MNKKLKKNWYSLIIIVVIVSPLVSQLPFGIGAELSATDEVLVFLRDVAVLDIAKYNATLASGPFVEAREDLGGLIETSGKFSLKSGDSKINVLFSIINDTLCWCLLDFAEGYPHYSQSPAGNTVDAANDFLQRYQAFTSDSSLNSMRQTLDGVEGTQNRTIEIGNIRMEISVSDYLTSFKWKTIFNGAAFSALSASFRNGTLYSFRDDRSYMKIGNTEVNLSNGQAVSKALDEASKFWYTYGGINYTDFTILESGIRAELRTAPKANPFELYPYWMVTLPLDKYYPGFVTMIMVEFWADTGELNRIYPLGTGGGPAPSDSPSSVPSGSVQPSQSPASSSSPAASASPAPGTSTTLAPYVSQSPTLTSTPSSTSQPTASPSLQPADNTDANVANYGLLVGVGVVVAVVVGVVVVVFVVRRRKLR